MKTKGTALSRLKRRLLPSHQKAPIDSSLPYPTVDLYYWRPSDGSVNFGDYLSHVIVSLMLARHGLTLGDETKDRHRLFAIGSVLHFASDGAVVWGSGVNGKIPADRHTFRNLDVRAVRGPFTRGFLMERSIAVPEVYGDPGLLLPHLTPGRFVATREKGPVFVPNLNDLTVLNEIKGHSVPIISPVTSWNRCISALLQHSLVLSSSLHGIVIAEAYGIPARYVRLTDEENLFKYRDYYAGTGRPQFSYASSIAEGLEMGGETAPIFDPEPLLRAFPFELWS